MTRVILHEADEGAWLAFADEQDREYAAQKVRAGDWRAEDAPGLARAANAWLRDGRARAAGHLLWRGVDLEGASVGWAWAGAPPFEDEPGRAFLYQITVEFSLRRRGLGGAASADSSAVVRLRRPILGAASARRNRSLRSLVSGRPPRGDDLRHCGARIRAASTIAALRRPVVCGQPW